MIVEEEVFRILLEWDSFQHFAEICAVACVIFRELCTEHLVFECREKAVCDVLPHRHSSFERMSSQDAGAEDDIVRSFDEHGTHGADEARIVLVIRVEHDDDIRSVREGGVVAGFLVAAVSAILRMDDGRDPELPRDLRRLVPAAVINQDHLIYDVMGNVAEGILQRFLCIVGGHDHDDFSLLKHGTGGVCHEFVSSNISFVAMKIVLATGIYPPAIGGPATYVRALAEELTKKGNEVRVVTYGGISDQPFDSAQDKLSAISENWKVVRVKKGGGPLIRWWRYARVLRVHGANANVIIAFSSVSCGVPLWLANLKRPKKILRLGGDFFWERYTDRGGMKSLREWYGSHPWSQAFMAWLLRTFDHIVFSTKFQETLYEEHYKNLPKHSVLENALPAGMPVRHQKHDPFRILFMGRFVGFKNLFALIKSVGAVREPPLQLTLVGDGPLLSRLSSLVSRLHIPVTFLPPVHGEEKQRVFAEHDLLILPSITEISPNVALEARAAGLPVLLTKETGLSIKLSEGMVLRDLSDAEKIADAIKDVEGNYAKIASSASTPPLQRNFENIAEEFLTLCRSNS